ncbi:hypothetical protein ACFZBU_03965 [Embleya sp. NPDC008237]|uniref:hypothetical protein n=1 Tax=Embleya sp. NPDC008237 TaxID=3363978 RepID=UPI0036ED1B11
MTEQAGPEGAETPGGEEGVDTVGTPREASEEGPPNDERAGTETPAAPQGPAAPAADAPPVRPEAAGTGSPTRRRVERPADFAESQDAHERHGLQKIKRAAFSSGTNGTAFYVENVFANGDGEALTEVRVIPFTEDAVIDLYEPVADHGRMAAHLEEVHIVALAGRVGSGRRATAAVLLVKHCHRYALGTLHREGPDLVRAVCDQADELLANAPKYDGYLLDVGPHPVTAQALDTLAQLARSAGKFLVLIGGPETFPSDPPTPHVFEHAGADRRAVLAVHLHAQLTSHIADCVPQEGTHERCDPATTRAYVTRVLEGAQIQHALDMARSVERVVHLARLLAENIHGADADGEARIIGRWRDHLPALARKLLGPDEAREGDPILDDPHRQALRIAYALFHGHPLSDAIEAGDLLGRTVLPYFEVRETAPLNHVFERDLNRLIPREMRASESLAGVEPDDNPRRALLVHEELLHAVLEVAWHEFPSLRQPLLAWLDLLIGVEQRSLDFERIRVRVAHLAGLLMRRDFGFVYREMVGLWARHSSGAYRQCAALAMEIAAEDDTSAVRVATLVKDWARSPDTRLQDAAARTYGTSLGMRDVQLTLRELGRLGRMPGLSARTSVAFSTAYLLLNGRVDEVLADLDTWITSKDAHLPRHAVRAMLAFGRYTRTPDRRGRPALAELALKQTGHRELLTNFWRHALSEQETSARAWHLLERWLADADGNDDLAQLYVDLAPRFLGAELTGRSMFHLGLWRIRHPDSHTLRRVQRSLATGTGEGR